MKSTKIYASLPKNTKVNKAVSIVLDKVGLQESQIGSDAVLEKVNNATTETHQLYIFGVDGEKVSVGEFIAQVEPGVSAQYSLSMTFNGVTQKILQDGSLEESDAETVFKLFCTQLEAITFDDTAYLPFAEREKALETAVLKSSIFDWFKDKDMKALIKGVENIQKSIEKDSQKITLLVKDMTDAKGWLKIIRMKLDTAYNTNYASLQSEEDKQEFLDTIIEVIGEDPIQDDVVNPPIIEKYEYSLQAKESFSRIIACIYKEAIDLRKDSLNDDAVKELIVIMNGLKAATES